MPTHVSKATNPSLQPSRSRGAYWLVLGYTCAAVLVASASGCERSRLSDGLTDTQDCSACHGSSVNAAPPKGVRGSTDTRDVGVGAHQAHLVAGHVAAPVACTECHPIPTDLLSHPDPQGRPTVVVFGPKASLYRLAPVWDRKTATCADTYCHGTKLSGVAERAAPIWTSVDGGQRVCTSCHGNPPAGDHPASPACHLCHGEVVRADGTIADLRRHIDGNVDFYVVPDAGVVGAGGAGVAGTAITGTGGSQ